jgi:hypothetical protein
MPLSNRPRIVRPVLGAPEALTRQPSGWRLATSESPARFIGHKCLTNLGLRQAKLPGNSRWGDTGFEGGPHGVHLTPRQTYWGNFTLPLLGRLAGGLVWSGTKQQPCSWERRGAAE